MRLTLPLVPQRPQPNSNLARRILDGVDVFYYALFRLVCAVVLVVVAASCLQRIGL